MKTLLAHHELAGPVDTLEAQRASRVDKLADKSLGTLVKALFESYAVVDDCERDLLPEGKTPTDRVAMAFSQRMVMAPERLAQARAAVEDLVAMRNQLVHHLIDRFDLWSDDGCAAAARHLEACYERIDQHFGELAGWARSMDEARALMASFTQSDAFRELVVNGIAPDGSFEWPVSGIVGVLRKAEQHLSEGGWTRLDRAREWMASTHPEQTPQKYGCRAWPQVLSESRQFDLEYRVGEDGRKLAWYRARALRSVRGARTERGGRGDKVAKGQP
ncbi:OST-HTH/LOTUS domain-containing protein [Piscinibacter sp. Jin2]|uniref:OST-HTH/LOTUS domain-containing protein n=2 Tax=Aquariibacter lacus TaxID=2801332 RepID=A0A9X0XDA5_9BURK|nr:OST-HTH/LOTUS domain-containing protein [Piscinibacter lacus]